MPARNERNDRIRQDITDISSADELLRFATAGQLAKLQEHRPDLTLGRIAQGAGLGANSRTAGPVLATALNRGPTLAQLHGLTATVRLRRR